MDERPDEAQDLGDALRVDRDGRFVEDEDVGRLHQRVGDPEALAHAARIRLDESSATTGQPDLVEDLVDRPLAPRRRAAR